MLPKKRDFAEDRMNRKFFKTTQEYLAYRVNLKPFIIFHIPNGGYRNKIEAAMLKAMGVKPGVADYIILANGFVGFMEGKSEKGQQSPNQITFEKECNLLNIPYKVFRSIPEGLNILKDWGFLP